MIFVILGKVTKTFKYIDDGYALPIIDKHELDHPRQGFLPHHGVYKKSADKKKLRIVFWRNSGV